MSVTLYLAIPCYNEEAVLPETARVCGRNSLPCALPGRSAP